MKTKLVLIAFALLAGCGDRQERVDAAFAEAQAKPDVTKVVGRTKGNSLIERFHDDEMNATCWIVYGRNPSCIPDTMLVKHKGMAAQ